MPTPRSNTGATRPRIAAAPARRLVDAGQQAQQRRLARAVVPDEPDAVAVLQRQVDVAQRLDDRHLLAALICRRARPRTDFFSDRVLASKIGKSTQASRGPRC